MTVGSVAPDLSDLLAACGFAAVGNPPTMTLDLLGRAVHASVRGGPDRLSIEVRVASAPVVADLEGPGLAAPGDTVFEVEGRELLGHRTLVAPSAPVLHDAVYDLAKAVVRLGSALPTPARSPEVEEVPVAVPPDTVTTTAPAAPAPVAPAVPVAAAAPGAAAFWCFVDVPTDIRRAPGSDEVVARMMPGVWYEATTDDGTWVHVRHPSGVEGVVRHPEVNPA